MMLEDKRLSKDKIEQGKEMLKRIETESDVVKAARDAVHFAEDFIDWDRIEFLESDYQGRTVIINLFEENPDTNDRITKDIVGLKLLDRHIRVLDVSDLDDELYKGKRPPEETETRIEGRIDIQEEAGKEVLAGRKPPETIRYQYQHQLDIIAPDGKKEAFWKSCMTVFRYFHKLRKDLEDELDIRNGTYTEE